MNDEIEYHLERIREQTDRLTKLEYQLAKNEVSGMIAADAISRAVRDIRIAVSKIRSEG